MPLLVAVLRRAPYRTDHAAVTVRVYHGRDRAVLLGLAAGVVSFAGTLYWITEVMVTFGGLPRPVGVAVNGLLVAYLALFPAAFTVIVARCMDRLGSGGLVWAPGIWVATELGRTKLFGGFPWVLLGYSQASTPPVTQLASLFGVYGISALLVLVNVAIAYVVVGRGRQHARTLIATLACLLVTVTWGEWRLRDGALLEAGEPIQVGMVQGNVAQEDKWDPARASQIFADYLRMSREAAQRGARFVVWPESSTPFPFGDHKEGTEAILRVARETGAHILLGSEEVISEPEPRIYNAAFLVAPDGSVPAVYRKVHLVPFGEYIPLRRLLFFASPLVERVAEFSPGTDAVPLPVGGQLASTAICYEVVYPALIGQSVDNGSALLTTITNDAWYGTSSAPYQHFVQASMRAVEQGRYLIRAANTGISGIVDPYGRPLVQSGLFTQEVIVGEARFLRQRTVYGIIGDSFAYLCSLGTLGVVAALWATRRRSVPSRRPSRPAEAGV